MGERRNRYSSEFGSSVSTALAEARMTANDLATATGVSASYLSQMMTGRKHVSPEWVEIIAAALKAGDERRGQLHLAAAKDAGYDVDLTRP
jgi:DNA-binding transcriptional regulator YdaS (Cro superfamily)